MSPSFPWTFLGSASSTLLDRVVVLLLIIFIILLISLAALFGRVIISVSQTDTAIEADHTGDEHVPPVKSVNPSPSPIPREHSDVEVSQFTTAIKAHHTIAENLPSVESAKPDPVPPRRRSIIPLEARKIQGRRYKHKRTPRARSARASTSITIHPRSVLQTAAASTLAVVKGFPQSTPGREPASIVAIKEILSPRNVQSESCTESAELEIVAPASSADPSRFHCPRSPTAGSFSLPYTKAEPPQISLCSGKPSAPNDLLSFLTCKSRWSIPSIPDDWIRQFCNALPPIVVYSAMVPLNPPDINPSGSRRTPRLSDIPVVSRDDAPLLFTQFRDRNRSEEPEDEDGRNLDAADALLGLRTPRVSERLNEQEPSEKPKQQPQPQAQPLSQPLPQPLPEALSQPLSQPLPEPQPLPKLLPEPQPLPQSLLQPLPEPQSQPPPPHQQQEEQPQPVQPQPQHQPQQQQPQLQPEQPQLQPQQQLPEPQSRLQQQWQPTSKILQREQLRPPQSHPQPQAQEFLQQQRQKLEQLKQAQAPPQQQEQPQPPQPQSQSEPQPQPQTQRHSRQVLEKLQCHQLEQQRWQQLAQGQQQQELAEQQPAEQLQLQQQPTQHHHQPAQQQQPHPTQQQQQQQPAQQKQQQQQPQQQQPKPQAPPQPLPSDDVDMEKEKAPADTVDKMDVVADVPAMASTVKDVEMADESTDGEVAPMMVDPVQAMPVPIPVPMQVPSPAVQTNLFALQQQTGNSYLAPAVKTFTQKFLPKKLSQQRQAPPQVDQTPVVQINGYSPQVQATQQQQQQQYEQQQLQYQQQSAVIDPVDLRIYESVVDFFTKVQGISREWVEEHALELGRDAVALSQRTGATLHASMESLGPRSVLRFIISKVSHTSAAPPPTAFHQLAASPLRQKMPSLFDFIAPLPPLARPRPRPHEDETDFLRPLQANHLALDERYQARRRGDALSSSSFATFPGPATAAESARVYFGSGHGRTTPPLRYRGPKARMRKAAASPPSEPSSSPATAAKPAGVNVGSGLGPQPRPLGRPRTASPKARMPETPACPSSGPTSIYTRVVIPNHKSSKEVVEEKEEDGLEGSDDPKVIGAYPIEADSETPAAQEDDQAVTAADLEKPALDEAIEDKDAANEEKLEEDLAIPQSPSGQCLGKRRQREDDKVHPSVERPRKRRRLNPEDENDSSSRSPSPSSITRVAKVPRASPSQSLVKRCRHTRKEPATSSKTPVKPSHKKLVIRWTANIYSDDDAEPRGRNRTRSQDVKTRRRRSPSISKEVPRGSSPTELDDARRKSEKSKRGRSRSTDTKASSGSLGKRRRDTEVDRDARAVSPPSRDEVVAFARDSFVPTPSVSSDEEEEVLRYSKRARLLTATSRPIRPTCSTRSPPISILRQRPSPSNKRAKRVRVCKMPPWLVSVGRILWPRKRTKFDDKVEIHRYRRSSYEYMGSKRASGDEPRMDSDPYCI